mgnify:FL=1
MLFISIQDLESAINFWRDKSPSSGDELILCEEVSALAKPYAWMIVQGAQRIPSEVLNEKAREAMRTYLLQRSNDESNQPRID